MRGLRQGQIPKLIPRALPENLTSIQEQVLVGLLLGDGCLYRRKSSHTPYLSINRQAGDRVYLEWTAALFSAFLARPIQEGSTLDARTGATYHRVTLTTRRATVFESFYQQWYPHGTKVVPPDLVLTPLTLAVWFADDGHVRPSCSPWRLQLKLSTMGFQPEEVDRLADLLRVRYGQYFSALWEGGKKHLNAADAGTRAFLQDVDAYLPPGLERKAYWRQPEARFYVDQPDLKRGWGSKTSPRP